MSRSRNRGSNPIKTEENADIKASEVGSKKIKYAFHISPECMKAINETYKKDGSSTRNEFIENAVDFYIYYLTAGKLTNYLAPIIKRMVEATVEVSEHRINRNLFKIAVELGKISRMVAAINDIDDETVDVKQNSRSAFRYTVINVRYMPPTATVFIAAALTAPDDIRTKYRAWVVSL